MNRDILRLALPDIISNITIPLLGLVDLALMGHLKSELYIGAIALGGVIFNFIYLGVRLFAHEHLRVCSPGSRRRKQAQYVAGSNFSGIHARILLSEPILGEPCTLAGHGAFHVCPGSGSDFFV